MLEYNKEIESFSSQSISSQHMDAFNMTARQKDTKEDMA